MIKLVINSVILILFAITVTYTDNDSTTITLNMVYKERWEAEFTNKHSNRFNFPISYFHVDLCDKPCKNVNECMVVVREMQKKQITVEGLNDIIYNFLIDARGLIYEGTGWYRHTLPQEKEFLSICFFGYDNKQNLSEELRFSLNHILEYGKYYRYLCQNVTLLPHPTDSTSTSPLTMTDNINQNKTELANMAKEFFIHLLNEDNNNRILKSEDEIDSKTAEDAFIALEKQNASWDSVFPARGHLAQIRLDQVLKNQTIINQDESNKILKNRERLFNVDLKSLIESNHQEEWKKLLGDDDDDDDDDDGDE